MYFTQEDYRNIERWLSTRTVKDSQFKEADPLSGVERIPLIQDGINKTVDLNTFLKQLSLMELPDFLNVTVLTKRGNLFLEEALNAVPVSQRKLGLTITFHNEKGNWVIYQFKGTSLNQWSTLNCWSSLIEEALEELVFYPDEEDITGIQDGNRTFLKFKDRDYNPAEFSGMGRIILRKNLVGTQACSLDDEDHYSNILTQDMIREENTVYIVQYDFDLDGKVISIPAGCTLWFQGGSINNGSIYLQETAILGAFEFADMGNAKLFGKFNTGQIMTFSDDSYKAKTGGYFTPSTKPSSATPQEDPKQDRETFYDKNPNAYTTETRQELRWWNGEEWLLMLDITDYNELKSIINDLIDKHNAEMSACYKYFKARCYTIEQDLINNVQRIDGEITNIKNRLSQAENNITDLDNRVTVNEGNINSIRNDISTINGSITTINSKISNLTSIINNLDTTINNAIQQYLKDHVLGVVSITVNGGNAFVPNEQGNVNLEINLDGHHAASADRVAKKLKFTGTQTAEYDGSEEVTITLGGEEAPELQKLVFKGAVSAEYNGSKQVEVTIPEGGSEFTPKTLTIESMKTGEKVNYNGTEDTTVKSTAITFTDNINNFTVDTLGGDHLAINLRPYSNGDTNLPIILGTLQLTRTNGNYTWSTASQTLHPSIAACIVSANSSNKGLMLITLQANNGWTVTLNGAMAVQRDIYTSTGNINYSSKDDSVSRSRSAWMQVGWSGNTIYIHGWQQRNDNNNAESATALTTGHCVGISVTIIGWARKL